MGNLRKGIVVKFLDYCNESNTTENLYGSEPQNSRYEFVFYPDWITAKVVKYCNSDNIQLERILLNGRIEKFNVGKRHIRNKIAFIKNILKENNEDFENWLIQSEVLLSDFFNIQIIEQ